jgi:formylglycine-generating enzyme required for sulfatase activity
LLQEGTNILISWNTIAAAAYALEAKTNLAAPWAGYCDLVATNDSLSLLVPVEPGARFFRVVELASSPQGMVLVPAGPFEMGNCMDPSEGFSDELPVHTVFVSAFCMDQYEVTKSLWDEVYAWAITHRYSFDNSGLGKAANHPVQTVNWYDVVKWCNARSEKEGRVPAYYTSAAQTAVYRTGQVNVQNDWVNWNAGYRLPTEAEWEKAARGGVAGRRFPWADADTITHERANYKSHSGYSYDISPTRGYHPSFQSGAEPYTSPVGSFAPNGYGLYDMAGNVFEWCWDWCGSYSSSSATDPRGPVSGTNRVFRSACWGSCPEYCRSAFPHHLVLEPGLQGHQLRLPVRSVPRSAVSENGQAEHGSVVQWGWNQSEVPVGLPPALAIAAGGSGGASFTVALVRAPAPLLMLLRNVDHTVSLSWTGAGTLEQTESLTPPDWQPAPTQDNPQTNNVTSPMMFYRVRAE